MREKLINTEKIEGYLYDSKLEKKTVQNKDSANYGKEYIGGSIDVLTSEDGMNIVTIKYTYVTPTTSKGAENKTYKTLLNIIDSGKTVLQDGKENATKVKINTSLALNEFYTKRNGEEELVSAKENNGGFITIVNSIEPNEAKRAKFEYDMYITGYKDVEKEDEDGNVSDSYGELSGWVFNFKKDPLPVTLKIRSEKGRDYFSGFDINEHNPLFTLVRGDINSIQRTYTKKIESAWGEPEIEERTSTSKEWVVNSSAPEAYPLGDEKLGITPKDVEELKAARAKTVAEIKARQEEYEASKAKVDTFGGAATSAPAKTQGYSF